MVDGLVSDRLAPWLARHLGEAFAESTIERIGIGHSWAMYRVTATDRSRVVVRVEQGGVFGTTGAEESAVMRGLFDAGYPVAQILIDDPAGEAIGRPLFVMEHLDGADAPGADERDDRRPHGRGVRRRAVVAAPRSMARPWRSTRSGNARTRQPRCRSSGGETCIGRRPARTEPAAGRGGRVVGRARAAVGTPRGGARRRRPRQLRASRWTRGGR